MLLEEFDLVLREILEKGFDDSFPAFCASTFSSRSYPGKNVAKAKMHAFYLRLFLEEYLSGVDYDSDYMRVGKEAIQEVIESENPTGDNFCRAFVEKWCSLLACKRDD